MTNTPKATHPTATPLPRPAPRPIAPSEPSPERFEVVLADDGPVGAALARARRQFERARYAQKVAIVLTMQDELARLRGDTFRHVRPGRWAGGLRARRHSVLLGLLASRSLCGDLEHFRGPRLLVRAVIQMWLYGTGAWPSRSGGPTEFRRAPDLYAAIFPGLIPASGTARPGPRMIAPSVRSAGPAGPASPPRAGFMS